MAITVKDILVQWLKANGCEGFVDDCGECGCEISDIGLCDAPPLTCCPGYRGPDPDGECDFLIYPSREAAEAAKIKD